MKPALLSILALTCLAFACGGDDAPVAIDAPTKTTDAPVDAADPAVDADVGDDADVGADAADALSPDGMVTASPGMVLVPAGPFLMGCDLCSADIDPTCTQVCDPEADPNCGLCDVDEGPAHEVTVSLFEIDITEVTQSAYQECVAASACTPPSDNFDPATLGDYPVTNVTWDQARIYCEFRGKRLPTEAEWEKAARGDDGRLWPWGNDRSGADCTLVNASDVSGCTGDKLPVGSLPDGASPYGALDMAGNVWEWTADYYDADLYQSHDTTDPQGPATGDSRVYRGGSAGNSIKLAITTNRADTYNPDFGGSGLGCRCARSR